MSSTPGPSEPAPEARKRLSATALGFSFQTPASKKAKSTSSFTNQSTWSTPSRLFTPAKSRTDVESKSSVDVGYRSPAAKSVKFTPSSSSSGPTRTTGTPSKSLNHASTSTTNPNPQGGNQMTPRPKPMFTLDQLSTPFKQESRTGVSPGPSRKPASEHRLNNVVNNISTVDDSPFKFPGLPSSKSKGKEVEKDYRPFTGLAIPLFKVDNGPRRDNKYEDQSGEEVSGLNASQMEGVSPSGKKGSNKNGLSNTLSSLISTSSSSLLLFYTAMQHTLNPPIRKTNHALGSRLNRTHHLQTPQKPGDNQPQNPTSITPLQHLRTASAIHLHLIRPIKGPTHHSTLFLCEILRRNTDKEKDKNMALSFRIKPGKEEEEEEDDKDEDHHRNGCRRGGIRESMTDNDLVLILFQTLPNECPRIGLDPRLLLSRDWDNQQDGRKTLRFEAGLWGLWTEIEVEVDVSAELPASQPDLSGGDGLAGSEVHQVPLRLHSDLNGSGRRKVFFASRYLVADGAV